MQSFHIYNYSLLPIRKMFLVIQKPIPSFALLCFCMPENQYALLYKEFQNHCRILSLIPELFCEQKSFFFTSYYLYEIPLVFSNYQHNHQLHSIFCFFITIILKSLCLQYKYKINFVHITGTTFIPTEQVRFHCLHPAG